MLCPPKTREEAEKYHYNTWAGNPDGTRYRSKYCAYGVWRNWMNSQCSRKPNYGPDNLYCKQHAKIVEGK